MVAGGVCCCVVLWCGVVMMRCVVLCCVCMLRKGGHTARTLSVCSFLQTWHGEELAELVVGNDSGMYKAGFAGDDAPRAVPSDVRHDSWYGPEGRKNLALHILQRRLQEGSRLLCSEECLQSFAKAASRGTGPKYKFHNDEE